MCGINGFYAYEPIDESTLVELGEMFCDSLVQLEERGTDAAGLFVVGRNGLLTTAKWPGAARENIDLAFDLITKTGGSKPIVIGHTRRATIGDPDDNENNHPHENGHVVGVHNGVYHAAKRIANKKPDLGLRGLCDSEVIFAQIGATSSQHDWWNVFATFNDYNRIVFWDRKALRLYAYTADDEGLAYTVDPKRGVVWLATHCKFYDHCLEDGLLDSAEWLDKQNLYVMAGLQKKAKEAA